MVHCLNCTCSEFHTVHRVCAQGWWNWGGGGGGGGGAKAPQIFDLRTRTLRVDNRLLRRQPPPQSYFCSAATVCAL